MARKTASTPVALGRRIRKRRQVMGLTLQQLSAMSGVSVGYLSQVERDMAVPTLGTLAEIAAALDVAIDHFIATPRQADSVTRAESRERFSVSGNSIIYEQVGAEFPGHELTSFVLNMPEGYASETVEHSGEELIFILEGQVLQVIDGQEFRLKAGDSIHYLGQHPHSWSNPGPGVARILWTGKMLHGATVSDHKSHSLRAVRELADGA
ncbi:cupin domain-containing protein [Xinfangfangia sp. CPCC 101601]|uniref:Cupin domain-containing protein n=1 Tax=Pseudogemmobacter lacusdianii TaxID=3069608 RepID=A0ABU0VY59_9RHOB|nr:cupin domain-containing protein [Xinfangfangia sp. CPCC 101601]MDQ2066563.1 cupin domain-containing protein [Xinfangfangia sp. CPCC 101601]